MNSAFNLDNRPIRIGANLLFDGVQWHHVFRSLLFAAHCGLIRSVRVFANLSQLRLVVALQHIGKLTHVTQVKRVLYGGRYVVSELADVQHLFQFGGVPCDQVEHAELVKELRLLKRDFCDGAVTLLESGVAQSLPDVGVVKLPGIFERLMDAAGLQCHFEPHLGVADDQPRELGVPLLYQVGGHGIAANAPRLYKLHSSRHVVIVQRRLQHELG
ncbi:lipid-A-disaccharide synthase [Babesia caballi]|uniref:Lipid-A-disaccharide synthase n=1 Tax=Babesia caballi TaxID=5871 RepID=A0AAV4LU22_BABCB|nr:lipid-A-disaccharide synthase [Babesia caballi]